MEKISADYVRRAAERISSRKKRRSSKRNDGNLTDDEADEDGCEKRTMSIKSSLNSEDNEVEEDEATGQ